MKFLTLTLSLISTINSLEASDKCPPPFEVEYVNIYGFVGNKQFACTNTNPETGCRVSDYSLPQEGETPGGCKLRNEPLLLGAYTRNYDCGSFEDHWKFACDMVERFNLKCKFERNPAMAGKVPNNNNNNNNNSIYGGGSGGGIGNSNNIY